MKKKLTNLDYIQKQSACFALFNILVSVVLSIMLSVLLSPVPAQAITLVREEARPVKKVIDKSVLVLPFTNKTASLKAVHNVWQAVIERFTGAGYRVAKIADIRPILMKKNYRPSMKLTISEAVSLAKKFEVDLVISGEIREYKSEKRFRITALPWGGSVLYSTVNLDCSIFDVSSMRSIYDKKISHTKKRQFMGAFQSHGDNLDYCLKNVINKIFNPFLNDFR